LRTAILYSPKFLEHVPGTKHPERPARLRVILRALERSRLLSSGRCRLVEPVGATVEDVLLVHDEEYVGFVERRCRQGGIIDLEGTAVSPGSFDAAIHAVRASITAVDLILRGEFRNAFVLARPPGHHAGPDYSCGFCIFNNVAAAAAHLTARRGVKRVLIVDFDAHHGNGTQDMFYGRSDVLYASLHQYPHVFPGAGFSWEVGEGDGVGYNVNIPLPPMTGDEVYLEAVDRIIAPIARQYKPQFILASVGFDVHHRDPVGRLSLTAWGQLEAFRRVLSLASLLCSGRFVAVLEGGYNLKFLGAMASADIAAMAGLHPRVWDTKPYTPRRVEAMGWRALREVKRIQSAYWDL